LDHAFGGTARVECVARVAFLLAVDYAIIALGVTDVGCGLGAAVAVEARFVAGAGWVTATRKRISIITYLISS